ncbi:iron-containing alcohol dehydrogenase family protein [Aquibacillus kalidii]|uniref:iron-containing alcohol dehydrogenase family protein n=1 Tax=Aquibacillus kalidii TaxID=2762597 RepID=UPI0016441483|nr:iron-containing alcohol dehydrogenase family protein [Aquibacillus kalidii]
MTYPITNIAIPAILEIKSGVIYELENILKKHQFVNVAILFDEFSYENYAAILKGTFKSIKLDTIKMKANVNLSELIEHAFLLERYDAVIAMGGGTVIDYGKYIAFSRRVPYISIPTSASNDGFASSNCSLIVNDKKTTVPAKVPFGIIVDIDIIQQVPDHFLLAGVGDLLSNITALYDWEYEEQNGVSQVNHFAAMLSKKAVNSFVRTPMTDIHHPIFIKELVSSLTMGGIATVISGNSAPISGSEHLISHALDHVSANPSMHGIQVGIATYIMANVQEHRAERIAKVFTRTRFFDYIKDLQLDKNDYVQAIKMGPSIKPKRYTYLHDEKYREKALSFIDKDPLLKTLWK